MLSGVLATAALLLGAGEANKKTIPAYSSQARSAVPVEYTWNIADINPVLEARKEWISSASKRLSFVQFVEHHQLKSGRVGAYIGFLADTDMGNTQIQSLSGELLSINVRFGQKFAFYNSDVLALLKAFCV